MFRLPDDSHRHVIVGRTGTGKSVRAAWHLSRRSFPSKPWIVVNPKMDDLLMSLGAHPLGVDERPPKKPGLYMVVPVPDDVDDNAHLERMMSRTIQQSLKGGDGTGWYFDEGYSIPNRSRSFRRILTQGRSLKIPTIVLSQRPLWMDRFVWSEADFVEYIHVADRDDLDVLHKRIPFDLRKTLPQYWSRYYDVGQNELTILKPTPGPDSIRDTIRRRLKISKKARLL